MAVSHKSHSSWCPVEWYTTIYQTSTIAKLVI
uniref:Uncharacterized protein n=1 Tax=Arundo donax TaxID=35708 RepID=A0A0A8ZK33_ARUDO